MKEELLKALKIGYRLAEHNSKSTQLSSETELTRELEPFAEGMIACMQIKQLAEHAIARAAAE